MNLLYRSCLSFAEYLFCLLPENKTPAKAENQEKLKNLNRISIIALFLVFHIPLSAKAADQTSTTQLIPVKIGNLIQYPLDAEPIEVETVINGLQYVCTLMPGDLFETIQIINYNHFHDRKSNILLQKRGGAPGNHQVCHRNSAPIYVMGTHEMRVSNDGGSQIVNKIHSPFIPWNDPENIQRRKNHPTALAAVEAETILFKKGDIIVYPLDADFIEVESRINTMDFNCTMAPGNSFKVIGTTIHGNGISEITFRKREETPENHQICPKDSFTSIETTKCVLKRTEEGLPEGLLCNRSLKTLFNPQEESSEWAFLQLSSENFTDIREFD